MKTIPALIVAVLALALPASATRAESRLRAVESAEAVVLMQVEGDLVIDADGSVVDWKIETSLDENLKQVLDRSVARWRFHPVLVEGRPSRVRSRMRVSLAATQLASGFQVKVDNVVFLDQPSEDVLTKPVETEAVTFLARSMPPPGYPIGLMRAGVGGRVLLALRFGEDGKVREVTAVQSMMFDIKGKEEIMSRALGLFEKAAVDGAKRWSVKIEARRPGPLDADDLTAFTTVEFVPARGRENDPAGQWHTVTRAPRREIPWRKAVEGEQRPGVADVHAGEMLPLAETLQFAKPVVGNAL